MFQATAVPSVKFSRPRPARLTEKAEVGQSVSRSFLKAFHLFEANGRYTSNCSALLVEPHNVHHHSMKWLSHVFAPLISAVIFTLLPPVKNAINTTRK